MNERLADLVLPPLSTLTTDHAAPVSPVAVYLASLHAINSRITMQKQLTAVARVLGHPSADTVAW